MKRLLAFFLLLTTTALCQTRTVTVTSTGALAYPSAGAFFGTNFYDGTLRPIWFGPSQNIGLNTTSFGSSALKVLALGAGTAPTTSPADVFQVWVADRGAAAGKAGLHYRAEDGTQGVISDHVGIGTLTPNLGSVTRALTLSAGTSGTAIGSVEIQGSRTAANADFAAFDFFHQTTRVAEITAARGGADDEGYFKFYTKYGGGALAERMRVTDVVLIGTTSDNGAGELQVAGAIAPSATSTHDLGSGSYKWRTIYADTINANVVIGAAPNPLEKRIAQMIARGNGTVTVDGVGDSLSASGGTVSAVNPTSTEGAMVRWATAASATARAYFGGGANYRRGRNISLSATVKLNQTANVRYWIALTDVAVTTISDADDPASAHIIGFRYSSGTDTNWRAVTKDGTTLGSTDTGVAPTTGGPVRLEALCDDTGGTITFKINGVTVATRTTNLPATSVNLAFVGTVYTTEAVAKELQFSRATIVSDQ